MKITLTGSLGNINRHLIGMLIAKGHEVKVISRDTDRKKDIEAFGAMAATGSINDRNFLTSAFRDADAVYLMIPPDFETSDLKGHIKSTGENYAAAIKNTGVKSAVFLSSVGAHIAEGLGPTGANNYVEGVLNELKDVRVTSLRPGMFYTNFFGSIPLIKNGNVIGNNFPSTVKIPMTHPKDIALAVTETIDQADFTGKNFRYVVSDEKTGAEIAQILGPAVNKPNLSWIEFSDRELMDSLTRNGMSEQMASVYIIEIGKALKSGTFAEDYRKQENDLSGRISFEAFASEFAAVYNGF